MFGADVKVKLSCPLAPAGMVNVVLLKLPPLLEATVSVTGLASAPRAKTVIVTEVPDGAQPGPASNSVALSMPTDAFIGPDICGSSVLFCCQPGTWSMGALWSVQ